MRNLWMAVALMCGSIAFASCNSNTQDTDTNANVDPELNAQAMADNTLTDEKREFMGYAYNISNQQVELGRLAVEKGVSSQVKDYGQQMIDIYSAKIEELQAMAQQYNVTLPQAMTDDQSGRVQELRDKELNEFDRTYWDTVVDAHKDAMGEFDDNVKDIEETDNTRFNMWARNTAKEVRAQMENAMRFRTSYNN